MSQSYVIKKAFLSGEIDLREYAAFYYLKRRNVIAYWLKLVLWLIRTKLMSFSLVA